MTVVKMVAPRVDVMAAVSECKKAVRMDAVMDVW